VVSVSSVCFRFLRGRAFVSAFHIPLERLEDRSRQLLRDALAYGAALDEHGSASRLDRDVPPIASDAFGTVLE
jgi:hypothetical protein